MNKKKLIAAVICLVLVVTAALPGTLAVSVDAASSDGTISVATPETAQTPADSAATDDAAPQSETEKPAEPETPAEPAACTCDPAPAEGEAHKEGCPLYVAPEKPAEPETPAEPAACTCDPAPAEGEAHKEGCPLYVAPEKPDEETPIVHIEGCSDDCKAEDCKCTCHLMKKIMECKTLEEIEIIIAGTPEEELKALSEEQIAKIEAYMTTLMPAPLPAIVIDKSESPVESEIVKPTVDYTYVAPFGAPVSGGN